jgi:hypothetical protein
LIANIASGKHQGSTIYEGHWGVARSLRCVAAQLEAKRNGQALAFATSLIRDKIRNSIDTLTGCLPSSPARTLAIGKLHREESELAKHPPKSIGFDACEGNYSGRAGDG